MDTFSGIISKEEFEAKDFSSRKRLELKNSTENKVKRKKSYYQH